MNLELPETFVRQLALPTISDTGVSGRFGNQCVLYVFGKAVADTCKASFHATAWEGSQIFDLIHQPLPKEWCTVQVPPLWWSGCIALQDFFSVPPDVFGRYFNRYNCRRFLRLKTGIDKPPKKVVVHVRRFIDEGRGALWYRPQITKDQMLCAVHDCGFHESECLVLGDSDQFGAYDPSRPFIADFVEMVSAENLFVYPQSSFSTVAGMLNRNKVWTCRDPFDTQNGLDFTSES